MNRKFAKMISQERAAERRAERGLTKGWLFDYQIGEVLRGEDARMYVITALPAVERRDRVVMVQRLVLGGAGQPLPGLREGPPFIARATKAGIRVEQGRLAKRVPVEVAL
jgi:hypothetical protein